MEAPSQSRQGGYLARGEQIGKYQILRLLAVGGMAEVYLGRVVGIEGFEKLVVIKRALPHLARNRDFIKMFLDEARLAATLQHPNIVQVYDIGVSRETYFFTMEFLHGTDLLGLLRKLRKVRKAVPIPHALTIVAAVASGLHYAHEKRTLDGSPLGIVHRDVSPANVFVTYDGSAKLVDFGIAKAAGRQTQTRAGTLKGKIAYMSPEQCRGQPLDRRSDVFALGVVLYEITLGRRPFLDQDEFALLHRIIEEDVPPPRSLIPEYPQGLEEVVLKALRRKREERYQSAEAMLEDIEALAGRGRIALSTTALARFLRELFATEIATWEAAQCAGVSLGEHLTRTGEECIDLGDATSYEPAVSAAPPPPTALLDRAGSGARPAPGSPGDAPGTGATNVPAGVATAPPGAVAPSALAGTLPPPPGGTGSNPFFPGIPPGSGPSSAPFSTPGVQFPVPFGPPSATYGPAPIAPGERGSYAGPPPQQRRSLLWPAIAVFSLSLAVAMVVLTRRSPTPKPAPAGQDPRVTVVRGPEVPVDAGPPGPPVLDAAAAVKPLDAARPADAGRGAGRPPRPPRKPDGRPIIVDIDI